MVGSSLRFACALSLMLATFPVIAADPVRVMNFPPVQAITGRVDVEGVVSIAGHPSVTTFVAFEDKAVTPSSPGAKLREWLDLGIVDATGHASVIASVAASVPPGGGSDALLELLLVPDVAVVREAMEREDAALFAIRVAAPLAGLAGRTTSVTSGRVLLAFPRWRAYLRTTGPATLRAHVFLMLGD